MTIKISELGNLTAVYGNVLIPVVTDIAGTLITVKGNLDQITTYVNMADAPYGNIDPALDEVYSLGSVANRWKDIHLSGGTIYLGNANLSISNNSIQSTAPIVASSFTANTLNINGNINASNISVSGTIDTTDITSSGDVTASGNITASDVTATGTMTAGDVSTTGNITASDVIVSGTITADDVTATGNLTAGEVTASNIAVSGNTITLGSATLDVSSGSLESSIPIVADITATSNLTMQGAAIDFAQGSYIEESEVAGMPGTYGLALNSPDDGIVGMNALDTNAAITSSVIVSNIAVQLNVANVDPGTGNINIWNFDSIGGVIFPDGTRQDTAYDVSTNYSNVQVESYLSEFTGVIGTLDFSGAIPIFGSALEVGANPTIPFANVIIAGTNNVNGYSQLNVQNINTFGNLVSADFIATAPNGTDSTNYIDMGINGNNFSSGSWTMSGANDGYVYVNGGNLTVGTDTPNTTVKVHVGGTLAANVVTTFAANGVAINGNLTVSNVYVPTANTSVGTKGQITYDGNYVYICVATNTWKRANLSVW